MKYPDLNQQGISLEDRVRHLEREAEFVRDFAKQSKTENLIVWVCSIVATLFSLTAILLIRHDG